jgi:hypothetical protein
MNSTIRGHNLTATVVMALLAVLVLSTVALVYALRPLPTTGHGEATLAHRAIGAYGARGSTITEDPNIERHAEVVERLGDGSLR